MGHVNSQVGSCRGSRATPGNGRHGRWCLGWALVLASTTIAGCGGPPQVLDDEECFKTVDALWTAVTARKLDLVENTAADLTRLKGEGKLSADGLAALTGIVEQARKKEWEPAAKKLKAFIQGQRRQKPAA